MGNFHNDHVWAEEFLYSVLKIPSKLKKFLKQFSSNVWAGLTSEKLIGTLILPGILTGESCCEFLTKRLNILLEDVLLDLIH